MKKTSDSFEERLRYDEGLRETHKKTMENLTKYVDNLSNLCRPNEKRS